MTFAEYNTDDNYDNKNGFESSLDELVKLGVNEGKTEEEIKTSLSPKWKNSKKINELSSYYQKHSANKKKAETPKVEETEEVKETVKETAPAKLTGQTADYVAKQNKIADAAGEQMQKDIKEKSASNWEELYNSAMKRAEAYKKIDDHMIENLPKGIIQAYKNNEFGDISTPEGKKAAKQRMGYFIVDNFNSVLKDFSNAAAHNAGRTPDFADTESAYSKYQKTNLQNALENRWTKYKSDTEGAIKAVEKEFGNEQDARLAAEQFTRDKKANTYWNMMDQDQKVYALQVTKEIGDLLGGMDTSELANFIAGSALTGDLTKDELVAIGVAKLANNAPDILANLPDGNIKNIVMSMIGGDATEIVAGFGGIGGSGETKESDPDAVYDTKATDNNKLKNPTGNLKGYKALDGKTYDFDTFEDKKGKQTLLDLAQDLSQKYYDGEIDAATYKKYLDPLVNEATKHRFVTLESADSMIKTNINNKLKELNKQTKNGTVTVNDYKEKTAAILAMAEDAKLSEKEINKLKKDFIAEDKIKYKGPKK